MRIIKAPTYYNTLIQVEKDIRNLLKFIEQTEEYSHLDFNTLQTRLSNCYSHFLELHNNVSTAIVD